MCRQLSQLHTVCGHVVHREVPCEVARSTPKNPWPPAIDTGSKVKNAVLAWCLKSLKPVVANQNRPSHSSCRPPLTLIHEVEYGFCPKCKEYYDDYAINTLGDHSQNPTSIPVQAGRVPGEKVFREQPTAGSGLVRQELVMLEQVTKVIGLSVGDGYTSRLEMVKEMRRKTLEWAEEGDIAREKDKMEQKAQAKKEMERERKREKGRQRENEKESERLRNLQREEERLKQKRLQNERQHEKKAKRFKTLDVLSFDEETFEEERRARKEKRHEVKKWLEAQKSVREAKSYWKNIEKGLEDERKRPLGKDKRNITVEIEDNEGKILIECERGSREREVNVHIVSHSEKEAGLKVTPRSTSSHRSRLDASERPEDASSSDEPSTVKLKPRKSGAVSDLVSLFESRSGKTESTKEKVKKVLTTPLKTNGAPTDQRRASKTIEQSTCKSRHQQPRVEEAAETTESWPGPPKEHQPATANAPTRPAAPIVPEADPSTPHSKPRTTSAIGTTANTTSQRPSTHQTKPALVKTDNIPDDDGVDNKPSVTQPTRRSESSKTKPNQEQSKVVESSSTVQGNRNSKQQPVVPAPMKQPQRPPTDRAHPAILKEIHTAPNSKADKQAAPPFFSRMQDWPKAADLESKPSPQPSFPGHQTTGRPLERTSQVVVESTASDPKGKAPETKKKWIDCRSVLGECGSTRAPTTAGTLSTFSINSKKVEYNPKSDRSLFSVGRSSKYVEYTPSLGMQRSTTSIPNSMKVEQSTTASHRHGSGSMVPRGSICSMGVEPDHTSASSHREGSTSGVPQGSICSMGVELDRTSACNSRRGGSGSTVPQGSICSVGVELDPTSPRQPDSITPLSAVPLRLRRGWAPSLRVSPSTANNLPTRNSLCVEHRQSNRSASSFGSMKADHGQSGQSTASRPSVNSMIVDLTPKNAFSHLASEGRRASNLAASSGVTNPSVVSPHVDPNSSGPHPTPPPRATTESMVSGTSAGSKNVEYTRSSQSDLWADFLQCREVEERRNPRCGWLVHPENCGCLGCIEEA
ncbi:hypothetical protein B0T20DRAFT_497776 [Sordaria brevicollis]|uniref:Uncharacterized protein n=1 Tax=Sordaria brevicollis TaxID=83679 RepID=A0AAE0UDI8_SORBR|nr:hypothetical protein B0T20DRAFT_497776 [Sordaria brevicollis]